MLFSSALPNPPQVNAVERTQDLMRRRVTTIILGEIQAEFCCIDLWRVGQDRTWDPWREGLTYGNSSLMILTVNQNHSRRRVHGCPAMNKSLSMDTLCPSRQHTKLTNPLFRPTDSMTICYVMKARPWRDFKERHAILDSDPNANFSSLLSSSV